MENDENKAGGESGEAGPTGAPSKPAASVIIYDKRTGRVIETHRGGTFAAGEAYRLDPDRVLREAGEDPFTLGLASGQKENLAAMEILPGGSHPSRMMVDIGSGKLVPKPRLQLSAAKRELEGDGKDAVEIEVALVDAKGKRIPGFDSEVEIRTSRGKLSARGGRVKLSGGTARVTLTSVAETVSEVSVSARSLGAPAAGASITFSFL